MASYELIENTERNMLDIRELGKTREGLCDVCEHTLTVVKTASICVCE